MSNERSVPDRVLLRSWKAIAAHLQVDVRTAQRWAAKTDIPIYRQRFAKKASPTAFSDELDHWLKRHTVAHPDGTEGDDAPAWHWRVVLVLGSVVVVALAVVLLLWVHGLLTYGEPSRCQVNSQVLRVFDASGRQLFSRQMPAVVVDSDRRPRDTVVVPDEYVISDVNNDGRKEVLYNVAAGKGSEETGRLLCLSARGKLLWDLPLGSRRSWEARQFTAKYNGMIVRVLHSGGRSFVLVVAGHTLWFPTQVALVDGKTGKLVDEYWHPGLLTSFLTEDFDADGTDEALLAGINNPGPGLGHGALVVLEVPFSKVPRKTGTDMAAFSGGREAAYVLFPRPDVCSIAGTIPFAQDLGIEAGRVRVRTACGPATMFHYLTSQFEVADLRFSDNFAPQHLQMERQHLLDHAMSDEEINCLKRVARFPSAVDGNSPAVSAIWKGCEGVERP